MFLVLGTSMAQDALTLVKANPADGATVTTVEYIQLEFSKDVEVTLPEGGIAVTNEDTKEVYNLTSYNPWTPKNVVLLFFEQKENEKGDMEAQVIKNAGKYSYTFPAGCIKTADGEEFTQTLSFTIDNPFVLSYSNPSNSAPVSQVSNIQHQFSKNVTVTLPTEPILIKHNEGKEEFKISKCEVYDQLAVFHVQSTKDAAVTAITTVGTYTYTLPAGVITSVDGETFPETTFTFAVAEPFEIVSVSPKETTKLEKIEITFSAPVANVKTPHGLCLLDNYWTPIADAKIKDEVTFSDDKKTVILELDNPITTIGTYNFDIYNGIFTSESGVGNEYGSYSIKVIDPTPRFELNYNEGDRVKQLGDLEITFKNVNEVNLVEGADPIVVYIPGDSEIDGTATLADNKITVSFGNLTEEGVYTFQVPAGFFTMDGVENEERSVSVELYTFTITPLEVVSVTPVEGNVDQLDKIIIEFNQNVTLSWDENWQQISQQIVLKGENKDYTLTYNSMSNLGKTLEYLVNAEWTGYEYAATPITDAGKYTLDLSQIIVDHAGESYIDEYGYPNTKWHSKNQVCSGSKTWTIAAGESSIDDVVVENGAKVIYDLTGRRIENITKAGIYIVNGKKVLVK
ncbi:MAG: copper resistance protein CopC [Bacteroidaceae bacterium]|nr:copper resistance protein CopC [Bacteroidaceae bacterium]